jgi:hypothetical protein
MVMMLLSLLLWFGVRVPTQPTHNLTSNVACDVALSSIKPGGFIEVTAISHVCGEPCTPRSPCEPTTLSTTD